MAENSYSESDESPDAPDSENQEILDEALARFALVEEAENENRLLALEDLEFASGNQWDEAIKQERASENRPCLTINRLPQHIKQVTNDQRQNRPSIKVHPVDDFADLETAKVLSGLIRHIEYNSNADAAYDTAFESAVRAGRGFLRVITQYVSPTSFDQEILIKRVRNPFSVYFDPHSQEPDGSDANYGFIVDRLQKDEYARQFPNSKLSDSGEWELTATNNPKWIGDNSAQIVEYFYKDYKTVELVLLSNGETVEKSKLKEYATKLMAMDGPVELQIVRERTAQVPVIKWCKLNACEILEQTEWPGSFIPIVPVYGEELDINGKRILKGIVRDAKDPQRMLNFWKSAETEAIALAPRAPYIADAKSIEGFEAIWKTANRKNHAYLPYNTKPGVMPPQRQAFEPAVQAITQASMLAADDLKATTGIYDAALGARSNETSGVAIQRRNVQAQTSNFHFVDNLTRSLRHTGRIVIDLIPRIYDTARAARIIGEDGEAKVIKLNQPFEENGKPVTYDLSAGKYDVTVDVGPSFASKRQEAASSMIEIARAVPQMMQIAGDLIVKQMDWPCATDIAERLKKALPPGLADDPKDKAKELPPQVQAQMQQMNGMIEHLTSQLNEANQAIETKRVELESKERIEMAKLETQATIELAKLESKESLNLLAHQIAELDQRTKILAFDEPMNFGGQQPQQSPRQPQPQMPSQDFGPAPAGVPDADGDEGSMQPTGGQSPGSPMDQNSNDDPNAY